MLSGDDNGVELNWLDRSICMLLVLDSNLSLPVRPQPPQFAALSHIRQLLTKLGRNGVRERHAVLSLIARIAKHDTLVSCTNIQIILTYVDTTRNVWTLLVYAHQDLTRFVAQALAIDAGEIVHVRVETDV